MNDEIEQRIREDLRPDEKLLWSGRPAQGLRLRRTDWVFIPFSVLWAGLVVYWESSVLHQRAPGLFAFWGIPFVLAGIYLLVGRFYVDAVIRTRTCYGLTNQRVIILSGLWTRQVKSLSLRTLPEISLREGPGARGTIEFDSSPWPMMQWFPGMIWPGISRYQPPSFELVERAREVYDLVRMAQQEAAGVPGHAD